MVTIPITSTKTFGLAIQFDLGADLSDVVDSSVIIISPDGSRIEKNISVTVTDATNGILSYITEEGDLSRTGIHLLQAVVLTNSGRFLSKVVSLRTEEAL